MKIINRENIIPVVCVSYTVTSIFIIFSEAISTGVSPTHFNLIMGFVYTVIAVLVLSKHYLLDRFSPLMMIVIQYIVAIAIVTLITFVTSLFMDLHPDAYIDSTRSFSIAYGIGATYYYINLMFKIKKQNKILALIKDAYNSNNEMM